MPTEQEITTGQYLIFRRDGVNLVGRVLDVFIDGSVILQFFNSSDGHLNKNEPFFPSYYDEDAPHREEFTMDHRGREPTWTRVQRKDMIYLFDWAAMERRPTRGKKLPPKAASYLA